MRVGGRVAAFAREHHVGHTSEPAPELLPHEVSPAAVCSLCAHCVLTVCSLSVLTVCSLCAHCVLTVYSLCAHCVLTVYSLCSGRVRGSSWSDCSCRPLNNALRLSRLMRAPYCTALLGWVVHCQSASSIL